MRKRLLLIVLAFTFLLVGCGATKPENERSEADQMKEKIENAMYEVLGDDLKKLSEHEVVATLKYGFKDGTGDGIQYHMIKSTYYEADPAEVTGFNTEAIGVLFDPEYADSVEEMQIKDRPGCRYRVGEKSYLCFTYDAEMTYVLEYNADEVSDEEILKMAESAETME